MNAHNMLVHFFHPLVSTNFFKILQTLSPSEMHRTFASEFGGLEGSLVMTQLQFFWVVGRHILFCYKYHSGIGDQPDLLSRTPVLTQQGRAFCPHPISTSGGDLPFLRGTTGSQSESHVSCTIELPLLWSGQSVIRPFSLPAGGESPF